MLLLRVLCTFMMLIISMDDDGFTTWILGALLLILWILSVNFRGFAMFWWFTSLLHFWHPIDNDGLRQGNSKPFGPASPPANKAWWFWGVLLLLFFSSLILRSDFDYWVSSSISDFWGFALFWWFISLIHFWLSMDNDELHKGNSESFGAASPPTDKAWWPWGVLLFLSFLL